MSAAGRGRRARHAKPAATTKPPRPHRRAGSRGTASYVAIPTFVLVYVVVALVWRVPLWVAGLYAAMSLVSFMAYALDKSAAEAGRWRIAESTLLTLGLFGGWPGAIVAQQVLRHKTSKVSFRSAFWGTVGLNVAGFVALHSPLAQAWGL